MCRALHFEDCEEGTARAIYSDWKSMQPILGTIHLPIPSMCFHVFTWPWSLATFEWSSDTRLWNSFFLFFQTDSENEESLLVAEAVSWHSWEPSVVVFLTCVGCQIHKESEGDRQRSRDKSGGAGRQAFISSFPGLHKAQRCISPLTMDTPCPSNQALFCLGYFEMSLCPLKSRDFFQRTQESLLQGRGRRWRGPSWMEGLLWRCLWWEWPVRMWWWWMLRQGERWWTPPDFKGSLPWLWL